MAELILLKLLFNDKILELVTASIVSLNLSAYVPSFYDSRCEGAIFTGRM